MAIPFHLAFAEHIKRIEERTVFNNDAKIENMFKQVNDPDDSEGFDKLLADLKRRAHVIKNGEGQAAEDYISNKNKISLLSSLSLFISF